MAGFFNLTNPNTFETVSRNSKTGLKQNYHAQSKDAILTETDVTLEIYAVKSCSELPEEDAILKLITVGRKYEATATAMDNYT